MKKTLAVASLFTALALGSSAYAAGNNNTAVVSQFGFANSSYVYQGGFLNTNAAAVGQTGIINNSGISQGGLLNTNAAGVGQLGVFNNSWVVQR